METILLITVSVLSTLGVAAIVLSIVNALNRLKGKVDVETMNSIERSLREDIENNYRLIDRSVEDIRNLEDTISKVDKRVDSRSDKLIDHMCREFNVVHEKIDDKKDSSKNILQD